MDLFDENQKKIFNEMHIKDSQGIIYKGLRSAGYVIYRQIKSNFNNIKKGKSRTSYSMLKNALRMERMQSTFGVKVGFTKKGFKYRFINTGTKSRLTTGYGKVQHRKAKRGNIDRTGFFDKAVEAKKSEALTLVSNSIIEQLNKVIRKNGGS